MKIEQNSWPEDLNSMHGKFGHHQIVDRMNSTELKELLDFRTRFLEEELTELKTSETADDVVDALVDLIVVATGTLDLFGVDAEKAWKEVHSKNMKKINGPNSSRSSIATMPDLIKPPGWESPNHKDNIGLLKYLFPQEN